MRMCVLSSEDLSYLSSVLDGLQRAGGTPVDAVPSPPASAHSLLSGEWDSQLLGFLPIEQQMSPIGSLQLLHSTRIVCRNSWFPAASSLSFWCWC